MESTLILSRKDGSIIKASGLLSAEKRRKAQPVAGYQTQANENAPHSNMNGSEAQAQEAMSAPAEELAASIFQFVQIAGSLGYTLSAVSVDQEAEDFASRRSDPNQQEADADGSTAGPGDESQVQLLRLRVKYREIIVFPDPQYLCCVVQRVGKKSVGR